MKFKLTWLLLLFISNNLIAETYEDFMGRTVTAPDVMVTPMEDYILSSGFGIRKDPMGGAEYGLHRGLDMVAEDGAKIRSIADGIVIDHWPPPDRRFKGHPIFGGYILILHENGSISLYGHMSKTFVHIGKNIKMGETIGIIGNTGLSTGTHLHFELISDNYSFIN